MQIERQYGLLLRRDNNEEVDFIIVRGESIVAIEVKSGRNTANSGMGTFISKYHPKYSLVVGGNAMPLEKFFAGDISVLL